MHAYDFTVAVPHTKGSLATLAEELGREKINIEGLCAVEENGSVIFHLLTADKSGTSSRHHQGRLQGHPRRRK